MRGCMNKEGHGDEGGDMGMRRGTRAGHGDERVGDMGMRVEHGDEGVTRDEEGRCG